MDFVEYPILIVVLGVESTNCFDIYAKGSEFDCLLRWCDSPFENFFSVMCCFCVFRSFGSVYLH